MRSLRWKTIALVIASVAAVVWVVTMLIMVNQNSELITKNKELVEITGDLERQNGKLSDQLECRALLRDKLDRAVGRGLAAVARDDSAELQHQAEILVQLTKEGKC